MEAPLADCQETWWKRSIETQRSSSCNGRRIEPHLGNLSSFSIASKRPLACIPKTLYMGFTEYSVTRKSGPLHGHWEFSRFITSQHTVMFGYHEKDARKFVP